MGSFTQHIKKQEILKLLDNEVIIMVIRIVEKNSYKKIKILMNKLINWKNKDQKNAKKL